MRYKRDGPNGKKNSSKLIVSFSSNSDNIEENNDCLYFYVQGWIGCAICCK